MVPKSLGIVSFRMGLSLLAGCSSSQTKRDHFLKKGKEYLEQHEYARAGLELRNASRAMPRDPEPYYQMALAELGLGELRSAVVLLKKTLELNREHAGAQVKL